MCRLPKHIAETPFHDIRWSLHKSRLEERFRHLKNISSKVWSRTPGHHTLLPCLGAKEESVLTTKLVLDVNAGAAASQAESSRCFTKLGK